MTRERTIDQMAGEVREIVVKTSWEVRGVGVEHGQYGCDSGCEYARIYVKFSEGEMRELSGSFWGEYQEKRGRELAALLGVPVVVSGWLDDDDFMGTQQ